MNQSSLSAASVLTPLCLRLGALKVAVVDELGLAAGLSRGVRQWRGTTQSGGPAETSLTSAAALLRGRRFHWKWRARK